MLPILFLSSKFMDSAFVIYLSRDPGLTYVSFQFKLFLPRVLFVLLSTKIPLFLFLSQEHEASVP
jgi:hypothetical protein